MHYVNTFTTGNGTLRIKVYTNSKRIYKLIENVLNFDISLRHLNPGINVNFYFSEINLKNPNDNRNFLYQSWLNESKNLLSFFGNSTATVKTNPKTAVVKATIFDYEESPKERILDFILMQPLRYILANRGLFFLHASVVCKGKDCILISGSQGSGKSTLALTLAQNGFSLLTDDDCFVKLVRNQTQLFPFPTKMGLTDKIMKRYPELNKYTLKNYRYGGKKRLSLNHIANSNNIKELRCKMIIFPRYKAKRSIYLKRIPKEGALDRLIKENPTISSKKQSEKMFWTLYNLTRRTDSFELIYNDERLDEIPEIINKNF